MKTILSLPGILLCMFLPCQIFPQCGPGLGPFTVQYDTTVYGTGSNSYSISLPKFAIPMGVLLSADVKSKISIELNYTLENTTDSSIKYLAKILRTDDIFTSSADLSSMSIINSVSSVNYNPLAAHQFVSYGPLRKSYVANDSIIASNPDMFNFMGLGNVDFDYTSTTTGLLAPPGLNFLANVKDTIRFSVSYLYCLASLLSQDLLFFSAKAQGKGQVLLNWRQLNIDNNRIYNLQVSTDGRNFKKITSVNENTTGNYSYTYFHNATTRLYFRIEEKEISGEIKYSEVRIVDPTPQEVVRVFPTLYTGGSLQIDFPYQADWLINIYSAEGRKIVAEKRNATGGNMQLTLPSALSNGTYTTEVINLQTQQKQFARIIVQR